VSLRFQPNIAAETVHVAGSFNGFSPTETPMKDTGQTFTATLDLPPGRHTYKYVVDGKTWLADPGNPLREEDGFGGHNSVLEVAGTARPSRPDDLWVAHAALRHAPGDVLHLRRDFAGTLVGFTASRGDLAAAWVEADTGREDLRPLPLGSGRELWTGRLPPRATRYRFGVRSGANQDGLGAEGWSPTSGGATWHPAQGGRRLAAPAWVGEAVFYQIFPDRFRNGDPSNDPPGADPWGSPPRIEGQQGGDLVGIQEKLPDLRDLGVTALYLNPVFRGESNHKYDTADFLAVDPSFGTTATLTEMVQAAHDVGVRVILDGVFNHTGDAHWAFQDLDRGRSSPYWDWFEVDGERPEVDAQGRPNYASWWGFSHLPEWRTAHPGVRRHVHEVVRKWAREADIDGWRLDVPNEVPHEFWKRFREWVRAEDEDAYLVGEIWQDGSPWMQGDEFDGVMNYRLRDLMLGFWARRDTTGPETLARVVELEANHPPEAYRCMLNLMGSHDTPRLRTLCQGDAARALGAYAFAFASPGAPCIYYGDEIGMEGEKDPGCREAYPWGKPPPVPGLRERFRRLTRLRVEHQELRYSPLTPLPSPDDWLLFRRGSVLVALRRGGQESLDVGARAKAALDLPAGCGLRGGVLGPLPVGEVAILEAR
jgi:glycosidase